MGIKSNKAMNAFDRMRSMINKNDTNAIRQYKLNKIDAMQKAFNSGNKSQMQSIVSDMKKFHGHRKKRNAKFYGL